MKEIDRILKNVDCYEVNIRFYEKPPHCRGTTLAKRVERGEVFFSDCFPDLDNRIKPIIDGIKGCWSNDMKVSRIISEKFFSNNERTEIIVRKLSLPNQEPNEIYKKVVNGKTSNFYS